ncbi:MAG TPA: hypothetical protein VMU80_22690, partial [Bryobacteraceae bacterium]|nr:hypothetical protein [Bryobacteraceae bacterium]
FPDRGGERTQSGHGQPDPSMLAELWAHSLSPISPTIQSKLLGLPRLSIIGSFHASLTPLTGDTVLTSLPF